MKTQTLLCSILFTTLSLFSLQARDIDENLVMNFRFDEQLDESLPEGIKLASNKTLGAVENDAQRGWVRTFVSNTNTLQSTAVSSVSGSNARTIALWVYINSTDQNGNAQNNAQYLFTGGAQQDNGNMLMLLRNGTQLCLLTQSGERMILFKGTTELRDAWHHVAFVIPEGANANDIDCYVDGELFADPVLEHPSTGVSLEDYNLNTYPSVLNFGHSFSGKISNFLFYDIDLTSEEVNMIYRQYPLTPEEAYESISSSKIYNILSGNNLALTDTGVGYSEDTSLLDEEAAIASPTMEYYNKDSYAQLWKVEECGDEAYRFINLRTGRYIWSSKVLPQAGETWREAKENNSWVRTTSLAQRTLYMGPSSDEAGLPDDNQFGIKSVFSEADIPDDTFLLLPESDALNSVVFIDNYTDQESVFWTIQTAYYTNDILPEDDYTSTTQEINRNKALPYYRVGKEVISYEMPFTAYSLTGSIVAVNTKSASFAKGFYLLVFADGSRFKVIIK